MKEAADTSGAVTEGRVATLQNHATLSNTFQHYPTLFIATISEDRAATLC